MTAAYCARVFFTQKSSYARVQLRMGFATDKNIFLTKAEAITAEEARLDEMCVTSVENHSMGLSVRAR